MGPNGAGKSTLLRILATLILPTQGRAAIADCDVERHPSRARITLTAEHMVVAGELDRQVRGLSTGMTHRVGLARAILHQPAVLLLDEPTRSLDPLAADFRRLLKDDLVRQHGTTLLFASQTLSEVAEIADRVLLLEAGRVAAFDSPRGLCAATAAANWKKPSHAIPSLPWCSHEGLAHAMATQSNVFRWRREPLRPRLIPVT